MSPKPRQEAHAMKTQPLETQMVDVSNKPVSRHEAMARARVHLQPDTLKAILAGEIPKGDVLTIAQMAGIQGAKRCPEWIPLSHQVLLSGVEVSLIPDRSNHWIEIRALVRCTGQSGVEMDALCAVSATALTIVDMCKDLDQTIVISDICLLDLRGGRAGETGRSANG